MKDFNQLKYPVDKKKKSDNQNQVSKLTKLGWGLLFLTLAGLALLLATNLFGFHSSQVVITSYQTLTRKFTSPGLMIRNEVVTFAPQQGKVDKLVKEGTRVRAGERILTLTTGSYKDQLYNYEPGIISYKIDGLENTLQGEKRKELTYEQFTKLRGKINSIQQGKKVNVGRPLFKVVDNFQFYLAVLLPQKKLAEYEVGSKVDIVFKELSDRQPYSGQIDTIITDKPKNIMIIEVNKFPPKLIDLRKTEVEVIKSRYHGLVVPEEAIIKNKDGITGVKIKGQTKNYFKEIEIKHQVGNQVVIKGVLPGVKLLLN